MIAASLALTPACVDKKAEPEWLKLPPGYNPVDADLTFNKANLNAFNTMSPKERDAHVENLKGAAGTFKGQALLISGQGLSETVEDSQYGDYEVMASVPEPVLFEITLDYQIFTQRDLGKALTPHGPIEFTGTLVDLRYDADAKPRKLILRVKADTIQNITK
ncbi:MAG: hypothetical protein R3B09_21250 [Nannocystaceae bacterium]